MSDDVLNHEIWVSFGGEGGKARGTVKARRTSIRKLDRLFSEPSIDNSITFGEYVKLGDSKAGKATQAEKKAAAGFIIAGKFKDGRRKISHQIGRSAIQIDIDYATPEQAEFILDGSAEINEYGYVWHTTRAHCMQKPRIRIIVPLSRMADGDESNAITRILSTMLADDPEEAIEIPDLISFRYNQIMYLPTVSKGQDYLHGINDAPILDVDAFLGEHPYWDDITKLPMQADEKSAGVATGKTKMEDPRTKSGVIGAFCRAYSIEDAIAEFLPDRYTLGDCSTETRYTYTLGSTANGLVIYDDGLFAQSFQATDPADGQVNAWDLVRKHLFLEEDANAREGTTPGHMPSFKLMTELALKDPAVQKERAADLVFDDDEFEDYEDDEDERFEPQPKSVANSGTQSKSVASDDDDSEEIDDEFDDLDDEIEDLLGDEDESRSTSSEKKQPSEKKKKKRDAKWQENLILDGTDGIEKTRYNATLIIQNDRRIEGSIAMNDLSGTPHIREPLKFPHLGLPDAAIDDKIAGRGWTDADTAALNFCLSAPRSQKGYGTDFARADVEDAMLLTATQNRFNPVLDTIHLTEWDGVKRIGTIFHKFLKTPDSAYIRELETAWFLASIVRLHEPGHDFQLVPILGGRQGGGKTGFIKALGFEGKFYGELSGEFDNTQKMVESTRGKWLLEVPELKGFAKGMMEDIKQYFSANKDTVRLAYRRNEQDFYRLCNYMGTTNEDGEYLKDDENRRFCPVPCGVDRWDILDFKTFIPLVPQIWAEAEVMYHERRAKQPHGPLYLNFVSKEAKEEAFAHQTEARAVQLHESVAEVVSEWLDTPVSAQAAESGDADVDEFDSDDDGQMYVRNYVTTTMIREQLAHHPVIRDLRISPDKVIGAALKYIGFERNGVSASRRLGRRARWWWREDNMQEFIPAPVDDVDDLLS